MKRDMDLIRLILLNLEAEQEMDLSGYSQEQIEYHNYLITKAGLAEGADTTSMAQEHPSALLFCLTWEGHDFIDAARDESIWKRAKGKMNKTGGTLAFEVVKALLVAFSKEAVGL